MFPLSEVKGYKDSDETLAEAYESGLLHSEAAVEFSTCPFTHRWTLSIPDLRVGYFDYKHQEALKTARKARFEFLDKN